MNSTPQLLARDRRAVAQGTQLSPGDLRMDAAVYAAVGADHQRVLTHTTLDEIRHVVAGWSADRWRARPLRQEHLGRNSPGVRKFPPWSVLFYGSMVASR